MAKILTSPKKLNHNFITISRLVKNLSSQINCEKSKTVKLVGYKPDWNDTYENSSLKFIMLSDSTTKITLPSGAKGHASVKYDGKEFQFTIDKGILISPALVRFILKCLF